MTVSEIPSDADLSRSFLIRFEDAPEAAPVRPDRLREAITEVLALNGGLAVRLSTSPSVISSVKVFEPRNNEEREAFTGFFAALFHSDQVITPQHLVLIPVAFGTGPAVLARLGAAVPFGEGPALWWGSDELFSLTPAETRVKEAFLKALSRATGAKQGDGTALPASRPGWFRRFLNLFLGQ